MGDGTVVVPHLVVMCAGGVQLVWLTRETTEGQTGSVQLAGDGVRMSVGWDWRLLPFLLSFQKHPNGRGVQVTGRSTRNDRGTLRCRFVDVQGGASHTEDRVALTGSLARG
jgi:hypothetical protein